MSIEVIKQYKGGCRLLLECPDSVEQSDRPDVSLLREDTPKPKPEPDLPKLPQLDEEILTPIPEPKPKYVVPIPTPNVTVVPNPRDVPDHVVTPLPDVVVNPGVTATNSEVHVPALLPSEISNVTNVVKVAAKAAKPSGNTTIIRTPGTIVGTPTADVIPAGGASKPVTVNTVDVTNPIIRAEQSAKTVRKAARLSNVATLGLDAAGYIADNVENLSDITQIAKGLFDYAASIPASYAELGSTLWGLAQQGDWAGLGTKVIDAINPASAVVRVANRAIKDLGINADALPVTLEEAHEWQEAHANDPFNWSKYSGH